MHSVNHIPQISKHYYCSILFAVSAVLCGVLVPVTSSGQSIIGRGESFSLSLSGQAQEAVENGVSLTFACDFAMVNRFLFFSWPSKLKQHRFMVSHHALSNRYIVRQDQQQKKHSFRSLDASMNYLSGEAQRLFNAYFEKNPQYEIRLSLSKYELPGPIRLSAFLASDWDLDTGWVKWDSEN
ncbi:MAG: hypothetical protein ACI9FR_001319 [Cryomorphaceae bacterium]|jgi:hypothetical protein